MNPNPKTIAKNYGFEPNKRFGQNFLIDKLAVKKIVATASLKPKDIVLEIGPGLGVLTKELAKEAKKVVAVEKDSNLVKVLDKELELNNVEIIQGDILKILDQRIIRPRTYKVVSNLPFYLTAPLIRKFLENEENRPSKMILVVQKEVAQRICAKPPNMNLLAVSVQLYANPKIICYISKKAFWPRPKVDSAVIKITSKGKQTAVDRRLFFKIVKAGFRQPGKQLLNNLSKVLGADKIKTGIWLRENNIRPNQRAKNLKVKQWINLTKKQNGFF